MKINKLFYLILLIYYGNASVVQDIDIIGNHHTKKHIIIREIHHQFPGEYNSTLAQEDRNRIYNLGLFSTVEIYKIDSTYTIFLVETFRFLPIPLLEYSESKGFSYGAGISYLNFRGLNEKLLLGGMIGEEETYFFNFHNPWVFGNHGSIQGEIYQFSTESSVYNYQYKIKGFEIGTGYYSKGEKHRYNAVVGIQFFYLDSTLSNSNYYDLLIINEDYYLEFQYLVGELTYQFDTRNIYFDPTSGQYFSAVFEPKFDYNNSSNYYSLFLTYKKYIQFSNIILDPVISLQTKLVIKFSDSFPIFAYEYLGGGGFVRGYTPVIQENPSEVQEYIEGFNILYQNFQIQHTLFKRKDYSGIEMGMDMVYFTDFGISANSIRSFGNSNLIYGYGVGLRIFISGLGVISLDMGFNPYGSWMLHPSDGNY